MVLLGVNPIFAVEERGQKDYEKSGYLRGSSA
jgi:hypothetical protein